MESLFLGGPKARQLVPHIAFVNFDPMLFAQQPKLILIVALRMVQFLILDVALDFVKVGSLQIFSVRDSPTRRWT
jgi:hypothetical protein